MLESLSALNSKQRQYLKSLAHRRKVIVTIGTRGLTDAMEHELATALQYHELLKVRLPTLEKADSVTLIETLCRHLQAMLIQHIGRVVCIYKPSDKPHITLP